MRAVRFLGNGKSDIGSVPEPESGEGKVLLKVHASALCGSENKSYFADASYFPDGYRVPGHEMSGEVVDAGKSQNFKKHDKAVVQIMNGCGECFYCQNGTYQFCESLQYEGGSHAQYISLPEKCVIKAPEDISYDSLVLLGGDTIGVAYRATQQLNLRKDQVVYVSGAGPIGIGMTALLKYYGCYVIVSELHAYRKEFIKSKVGADLVLDPTTDDIKAELRKLTDNVGPEIVIECSGNPKAQLQALELVRCQGTVLFAGENYNGLEIVPSVHIIHKELNVKGAFYFTADDFVKIVELYHDGLNVDNLVSHRVKLDDAPEVIAEFARGNTGKVIIHPQE